MKHFLGKFWNVFIPSALIFILFAIVFYLLVPLNVARINAVTVKGNVQSGGLIIYDVDYCQNVGGGIPREVQRYLEPKDTKNLNPIDLGNNPSIETLASSQGCHIGQDVKLPIDTSTPPGDYKLLIRIIYKFPLRDISVQGESSYFTIGKPNILGQLQNINSQLQSINVYLGTTSNSPTRSVSSIAPTIDNPQSTSNPQETTQAQKSGILETTINTINGILQKVK